MPKPRGAEHFERDDVIRESDPRSSSGPAAMKCCANRSYTWMHPTGCSSPAKATCTARAVHTWLYGHIITQLRRCTDRPPHHVTSANVGARAQDCSALSRAMLHD